MNNIPCKFFAHWSENQSPLGSGLNWPMDMYDCVHPDFPDIEKQMAFEEWSCNNQCSPDCPGYEAMEVTVCEKHGEFLKDAGCDGCMYDSYKECEASAAEYYGSK